MTLFVETFRKTCKREYLHRTKMVHGPVGFLFSIHLFQFIFARRFHPISKFHPQRSMNSHFVFSSTFYAFLFCIYLFLSLN